MDMELNRPYFMTNKDWYYFDEDELCYKLTPQATEKAKESYEEYYKMLNHD
jgi:hypothetical protein